MSILPGNCCGCSRPLNSFMEEIDDSNGITVLHTTHLGSVHRFHTICVYEYFMRQIEKRLTIQGPLGLLTMSFKCPKCHERFTIIDAQNRLGINLSKIILDSISERV